MGGTPSNIAPQGGTDCLPIGVPTAQEVEIPPSASSTHDLLWLRHPDCKQSGPPGSMPMSAANTKHTRPSKLPGADETGALSEQAETAWAVYAHSIGQPKESAAAEYSEADWQIAFIASVCVTEEG